MKRIPWVRAAAVGACASIALAVPAVAAHQATPDAPNVPAATTTPATAGPATAGPATPSTGPVKRSEGVTREDIRKAQELERYWTPERIRSAVPVDAVRAGVRCSRRAIRSPRGSPRSVCS